MDVYCGIDWAEDHHDISLIDRDGQLLARRRISDDAAGLAQLLSEQPRWWLGPVQVPLDQLVERARVELADREIGRIGEIDDGGVVVGHPMLVAVAAERGALALGRRQVLDRDGHARDRP